MLPNIDSIILVAIAGFMLAATPGPSMLYVLSRSMNQSYKAGLASSAGLAIGGMFHALAAAVGLASIVAYSPKLYLIIQIGGAGYLAYLGSNMLKNPIEPSEVTIEQQPKSSYRHIFWQGVIVEITNPKTILFFVAFIPSLLSGKEEYSSSQLLVLGILIPLTALPSDLIVSLAGGKLAERLKRNIQMANWINKAAGTFLIALALRLFLS
ncbi:LysE family translocator [Aliikangiella sp. IMCC44359]|uniref:LysE family translocator n=1 Tax=Aliikangiella sp. IMCC44359 TaxID=3459125 RepID=UPI00403AF4C6